MFEKLATAASSIKSRINANPKIGVLLGSGLETFLDEMEEKIEIPYNLVSGFPSCYLEKDIGSIIVGSINSVNVIVLRGRLHAYDGFPMADVVFPIRVLAAIGIETLILTGGTGGINSLFAPGDLVCIDDHINFMFQNPLIEENIRELGPKFPNMRNAYEANLRQVITECAGELNIDLRTGVYLSWLGPTYETPAEIRMIKTLGADMVGMSTVPECIAANHLGIKVAGICLITNMAAGIISERSSVNDEMVGKAQFALTNFINLLKLSISKMGNM